MYLAVAYIAFRCSYCEVGRFSTASLYIQTKWPHTYGSAIWSSDASVVWEVHFIPAESGLMARSMLLNVGRTSPLSRVVTFAVRFFRSLNLMPKAKPSPVDLDRIYARTKQMSRYPHLTPGRIDVSAYASYVAKFDVAREWIRHHDEIMGRDPEPLLALGWFGEIGTGIKQRRLRPKSPRARLLWNVSQCWRRFKRWTGSMEVGIDGV
jgi:hypothetical protein